MALISREAELPDAQKRFTTLKLLGLFILLIASLFLSFFLGRYSLTPSDTILLLRERLFGIPSGLLASESKVFF